MYILSIDLFRYAYMSMDCTFIQICIYVNAFVPFGNNYSYYYTQKVFKADSIEAEISAALLHPHFKSCICDENNRNTIFDVFSIRYDSLKTVTLTL